MKCMIQGCTSDKIGSYTNKNGKKRVYGARGLCITCYVLASRKVRAGKTTWKELEALGLCVPSSAYKSAFSKALEQSRLGQEGKDGVPSDTQ